MAEQDVPAAESEGIRLVITTLPDASAAEAFVRTLVDEGLIACGNIVPGIVSIYRWQGEVTREDEVLVLMKVAARAVEQVFERVGEIHPYEVPEIVEVPVGGVAEAYRRWVVENTRGAA